jgi:phage terminase large subunit-like protein
LVNNKDLAGSYFLAYYLAIENGDIIVGKEIKKMLKILKDDLSNPLYAYDMKEAHDRIDFIEGYAKQSISPNAGKPIKLMLFQKSLIELMYSFKMKNLENQTVRRFNEVLFLCGRKNGKSTISSGLALAEMFIGEMGTHILLASNTDEQTNILFNGCNNMREQSPLLEKKSRKNLSSIHMGNPKYKKKKGSLRFSNYNKSNIRKLSQKQRSSDGKQLSYAIMDEIHELKTNEMPMSIYQSCSIQKEYTILSITTEGYIDGYLSDQLVLARQVLKGEVERPRWLILLYTQDTTEEVFQDRTSWYKSNPSLGVIKTWDYLDQIVQDAKTDSAKKSKMLSKDFNIRQSLAVSWIEREVISNDLTFSLEDFRGSYCLAGVDCSETTDLTSISLLFKRPNDKIDYIYSHSWIPEAKLKNSPDDVDYLAFRDRGELTIVDGTAIDTSVVAQWCYDVLYTKYKISIYKVGYDNKFAKDMISKFQGLYGKAGISLELVHQYPTYLSNPTRYFEAQIRASLVNYGKNSLLFWALCNTGYKINSLTDQIQLCKIVYNKRIDPVASCVNSYLMLQEYKTDFYSLLN